MKKLFILIALIVFLSATSVNAGVLCIDEQGTCNDVKLIYYDLGSGFYNINGYEYGCGQNDRVLDGTARLVGNTVYFSLTVVTSTSTSTPYVGQKFYGIDLSSSSGTGTWAWHYDGYHWGTVNVSLVSCPVVAEVQGPFEPDSTVNE